MNKLLPILLIVVLSGCGKSPLENCADDYSFNKYMIISPSSMSFKEKLQRREYALSAGRCEELKREYPELFREKYK